MQQVPREPNFGAPSSQYEIDGTAARALRPRIDVDDFFVGLEEPASDRQDLTLALIRSVIEIREKRHRDAVCLLARMLADQDLAQRPRARRRG